MKVLVTGATGFIGSHLVAELARLGMDVRPSARRELGSHTDWAGELGGVDAIVHLAAIAHARARQLERLRDYPRLREVNALGSMRLAQCAAQSGVRRIVFLSTIGVHGEETDGKALNEASPLQPQSLYAASKLDAERLLAQVSKATGLAVTVLRPTLVYGPGNPGNMWRLLRLIDRGCPLPLALIANRRNLTYVGNLVSAIIAVLRHGALSDAFIVCDTEAVATPELVRCLADGLGRRARLFPVPTKLARACARVLGQEATARRLLGSLEADNTKLRETLNWHPPYDARSALVHTGARFRALRHGAAQG